jgi:hypothetical protein
MKLDDDDDDDDEFEELLFPSLDDPAAVSVEVEG